MKKKSNRHNGNNIYRIMHEKGLLYFLLSFIVPAVIMTMAFSSAEISPFGCRQMLVVDLWHQYYPFFLVLREKLLSGGSLLYSWKNGMGTNFLSLISYYAASPLNWISVFFPDNYTREALTFILILKIGFSGGFMSCFLRYTYRCRNLSLVPFSAMYALCSYVLGYYWNVMWFDTFALFPLVMLGVVMVCREKKWLVFTLSLALSLISNYYIGYFTCIFTIFMFAAAIITEGKGIKDFFVKLWIIARSSVLGICLGGIILLPAYYGLKRTYSVNSSFPKEIKWFEKWISIFGNLVSYNEPNTKEGLPNIACGMLAVMLLGVFIFSKAVKWREKILMTLLLAFIAVSCNLNILNYIWHGFHVTNQLPYRFSFIFSFILISAAYRAYTVLLKRGIKFLHILLMIPAPAAVLFMSFRASEADFSKDSPVFRSMIISIAYIFIFIAAKTFPFRKESFRKATLNIAVLIAVCSELVSNSDIGTKTVDTSDYNSYPDQNQSVQILLENMRNSETDLLYRTEMTKTYSLNDSSLYGYYGVSQFSSMADVNVTRFFRRLGLYASEAGNRYFYRISDPVANEILGIRYIISKNVPLESESAFLTNTDCHFKTYLYKSNYPLSLGFMMDSNILTLEDKASVNPFEYRNEIIRLATGIDAPVFTAQPVALAAYTNLKPKKTGYGNYTFTVPDSEKKSSATYSYSCSDDAFLYGYATSGSIENIVVKCDETTVDSGVNLKDFPVVFPMGNGQKGSTSSLQLDMKSSANGGSYQLVVYALHKDIFERAYEKFSQQQLEISEFSDTRIKGTVNAKKDGILYFAAPYDKGWTVYVDGKKTKTMPVAGSMLGSYVQGGEHEIVMEYVPEGFREGSAVSAISVLFIIILAIYGKYHTKKAKIEKPAVKEENNEKS